MIAIVDYGAGNLFSLTSSLRYLNIENKVTADPAELETADKVILPGVGAFGDAMEMLKSKCLDTAVKAVAVSGKPLLGICLGMQLLLDRSCEFESCDGLGLIGGEAADMALELEQTGSDLKVPHMGWNCLKILKQIPLLKNSTEGDFVYYVHSFYASGCGDNVAAGSEYGVFVPGVIADGNVLGCQFHPEKSGSTGLKILRAFDEI